MMVDIDIIKLAFKRVMRKYKNILDLRIHIVEATQLMFEYCEKIVTWMTKHPKRTERIMKGEEDSKQLKCYYRKKKKRKKR